MKYFFYGSALLFVCFCLYVVALNRNSKQMSLRQKVLKAVYPAFMWVSSKKNKANAIVSNSHSSPPVSFYSLSDKLINGEVFSFENLRGKKVLLVNTASDCGYTAQYEDLEKLSQQYKNKLVVIGFPSNDFNEQEKADNSSIEQFCKKNYGVSFMLTEKLVVKKSPGQDKIYQWLTDEKMNGWNTKSPSWNFCKYLVDENGRLTHFFNSAVEPGGEEIRLALEEE